MKLIILLIALMLERFFHAGRFLHRFNWFEHYLNQMRNWVMKFGIWREYIGVIIAILPPLILFIVIYWILFQVFGLLFAYIIEFVVILYCLGPKDIYYRYQSFFNGCEQGNTETEFKLLEDSETTDSSINSHRAVTKKLFLDFNDNIFAIIFWFFILGPFGIFLVLIYRMVSLVAKIAAQPYSNHGLLLPAARNIKDILDWIPIRVLGFMYALVGNFVKGFHYWIKNVLSDWRYNEKFAIQSGLIGLDIENTDALGGTLQENKAALDLVDRALIVFLVIIALLTLGTLL